MATIGRRAGTAALLAAGLILAVYVHVRLFGWLFAPVMLAAEFTVVVLTLITLTVLRSACCNRRNATT